MLVGSASSPSAYNSLARSGSRAPSHSASAHAHHTCGDHGARSAARWNRGRDAAKPTVEFSPARRSISPHAWSTR